MINSLTPEQKKLVPVYQKKWHDQFFKEEFNEDLAYKMVDWLYGLIGRKPPVKIVLSSPLAVQLVANVLKNSSVLQDKLSSKFSSKFRDKFDSEILSKLYSELSSKLRDELGSRLISELNSKLDSELRDELNSKLGSELNSKLGSELNSELDSELRNELYSELDLELRNKLSSELYLELSSKLNYEFTSELNSELRDELRDELDFKLFSKLSSELRDKLNSELDCKLNSELRTLLKNKKIKYYVFDYWGDTSWFGYLAFYDFVYHELFPEYKNVILEEYLEYSKANINFLLTFNGIAFLSKPPVFTSFDEDNRLHCTHDYAVAYADGYKEAFVRGIYIESELFKKYRKKELSFTDLLNIENIEVRQALLSTFKPEQLLEQFELISDESVRGLRYRLYSSDKVIDGREIKLLRYACPSTGREYYKYVPDNHTSAVQAIAESHHFTVEEYKNVAKQT